MGTRGVLFGVLVFSLVHPCGAKGADRRPADTPLLKACQDLKRQPTTAAWDRVLGLTAALKSAIDGNLPHQPYEKPLDLTVLRGQPDAKPGRHSLLRNVRYVSDVAPGPNESYIHTSAVFLDGDLVASQGTGGTPRAADDRSQRWDGYILGSVVIVNGRIDTTCYIADSIVVASGPIAVEGHISNSLVISLDSLLLFDDPDRPARERRASVEESAGPPDEATILLRDGYISKSVVIGSVACDDLRDCIVLGRTVGKSPYLRGAEIRGAGLVARLPWEIQKPQSLDLIAEARQKSGPQVAGDLTVALVRIGQPSVAVAEKSLARVGAAVKLIEPDSPIEELRRYPVVYFPGHWGHQDGLGKLVESYRQYVQQGGGILFAEPDAGGGREMPPALKLLPYPIEMTSYPAIGALPTQVYTPDNPHPLMKGLLDADLPYPHDHIRTWSPRWTVLASARSDSPRATLLVAEAGQGRVVLHTGRDEYGQRLPSDKLLVHMLNWLSQRLEGDEGLAESRAQDVRRALNDYTIGEADFQAGLIGRDELAILRNRLLAVARLRPEALKPFAQGQGRRAEIAGELLQIVPRLEPRQAVEAPRAVSRVAEIVKAPAPDSALPVPQKQRNDGIAQPAPDSAFPVLRKERKHGITRPAPGLDVVAARKAIANARHFLARQLDSDTGRCVLEYDWGHSRHGIETAMVLRALSVAGEKYEESPALRRGYAWLTDQQQKGTEFVALRVLAICASSQRDQSLQQCLAGDVKWLIEAASKEGHYSWHSQSGTTAPYNNAMADLVTMALHAASVQDIAVPEEFWTRNLRAWLNSQLPAGAWKYYPQDRAGPQYGGNFTMTAAGICAVHLCRKHLGKQADEGLQRSATTASSRATAWLEARLSWPQPRYQGDYCYDSHYFPCRGLDSLNPGTELRWDWLVNLGRLRTDGGLEKLGATDPWAMLGGQMIADQNDDGSWGGSTWSSGIYKIQLTAFGVLFLESALGE